MGFHPTCTGRIHAGTRKTVRLLIELTSRSSARTRPEVLHSTLSLALALTEADGVVLVLGAARHYERTVLRRGETSAMEPGGARSPSERTTAGREGRGTGGPGAMAEPGATSASEAAAARFQSVIRAVGGPRQGMGRERRSAALVRESGL